MRCSNFDPYSPYRCRLHNPRRCRYFDPVKVECSRPWLRARRRLGMLFLRDVVPHMSNIVTKLLEFFFKVNSKGFNISVNMCNLRLDFCESSVEGKPEVYNKSENSKAFMLLNEVPDVLRDEHLRGIFEDSSKCEGSKHHKQREVHSLGKPEVNRLNTIFELLIFGKFKNEGSNYNDHSRENDQDCEDCKGICIDHSFCVYFVLEINCGLEFSDNEFSVFNFNSEFITVLNSNLFKSINYFLFEINASSSFGVDVNLPNRYKNAFVFFGHNLSFVVRFLNLVLFVESYRRLSKVLNRIGCRILSEVIE